MKKMILAIIAVLFAALLFNGCAEQTGENEGSEKKKEESGASEETVDYTGKTIVGLWQDPNGYKYTFNADGSCVIFFVLGKYRIISDTEIIFPGGLKYSFADKKVYTYSFSEGDGKTYMLINDGYTWYINAHKVVQ